MAIAPIFGLFKNNTVRLDLVALCRERKGKSCGTVHGDGYAVSSIGPKYINAVRLDLVALCGERKGKR